MRLRNLLFVLLLCMTVGMLGASCADDGEMGPPGPQGEPGEDASVDDIQDVVDEAIDDLDMDMPEPMEEPVEYYNFLKSWGVKDGKVGCSDDIIMGMGPLPGGPDILSTNIAAITALPTVEPDHLRAVCSAATATDELTDKFVSIAVGDINTLGNLTLPSTGDNSIDPTFGIVFVKTGKGATEEVTVRVSSSEFNPPADVTTNKTFVGGKLFADLSFASDNREELLERLDLYSQCGVGTSPSYIVGDWRAVKIVDSAKIYKEGRPEPNLAVTTTTKICVRLDSHPGVTKCFVDVNAPAALVDADFDFATDATPSYSAGDDSFIALYDGTMLNKIVKKGDLKGPTTTGSLFDDGDLAVIVATGRDATTNDQVDAKLCNLFQ